MNLDTATMEAADAAGQLLIRAAATLARLSAAQQHALAAASALPAHLAAALRAAEALSPEVRRSMHAHPPHNFTPPQ